MSFIFLPRVLFEWVPMAFETLQVAHVEAPGAYHSYGLDWPLMLLYAHSVYKQRSLDIQKWEPGIYKWDLFDQHDCVAKIIYYYKIVFNEHAYIITMLHKLTITSNNSFTNLLPKIVWIIDSPMKQRGTHWSKTRIIEKQKFHTFLTDKSSSVKPFRDGSHTSAWRFEHA